MNYTALTSTVNGMSRTLNSVSRDVTGIAHRVVDTGTRVGAVQGDLDRVRALAQTLADELSELPGHVEARVSAIPDSIAEWAEANSSGVWELANGLDDAVGPLQDSLDSAAAFLRSTRSDFEAFRSDRSDEFRAELARFLTDAKGLGFQVRRIVFDRDEPVDFGLVDAAVDAVPEVVLFGLHQGLDPIPLWRTAPAEVMRVLERVPSIAEVRSATDERVGELVFGTDEAGDIEDKAALRDLVADTAFTVALAATVVRLARDQVPRDLEVTVTVVGGAGLTVSAYPLYVVLGWVHWVFELAGEVMKWYLDTYQRCADAYAAAEAARLAAIAEAELRQWRVDVLDALTEIRASIAG